MRTALLAGLATVLLACHAETSLVVPGNLEEGEAHVTLALDKASYHPGEPVTVTMTNTSGRPYGYNLCGRAYERLVSDAWVAMPAELRLCTADLRGLPTGATRTDVTDLPGGAPAGTYRMLVTFTSATTTGETGKVVATSGAFAIE